MQALRAHTTSHRLHRPNSLLRFCLNAVVFAPDVATDFTEQILEIFIVVLLSGKLGGAKIPTQMNTDSCAMNSCLYTSKVPFKAFFRVPT